MVLVLASVAAYAQTGNSSPNSDVSAEKAAGQGKQPPAFSAAGVQGSTAPSGYSSGLAREETSAVMKGVSDLNDGLFSGFVPQEHVEDCARAPALIKAAEADPHAFGPNHALGWFYLTHGDFARSIRFLDAARHAQPADIDNSHALALALLGAQRNPEAITLLEGASKNDRNDLALLRLLALAYRLSGERDKSIQAYQRASVAAGGNINNQFDCGLGLLDAGASMESAKLFTAATIVHPDAAKLWFGLGLVQNTQRQKQDAIQSLLRSIAIEPDYGAPYFLLAGLADASSERAAEIRKRLAEFVVSHPSSAEAHYDYALGLWQQQRMHVDSTSTTEIQSQLKLALTANPHMARAHFLLGVIDSGINDPSSAEKELLLAVKSDPENAEEHYRLAQAYKHNNKPDDSEVEMQRFLALHRKQAENEHNPETEVWEMPSDAIRRMLQTTPCNAQAFAHP